MQHSPMSARKLRMEAAAGGSNLRNVSMKLLRAQSDASGKNEGGGAEQEEEEQEGLAPVSRMRVVDKPAARSHEAHVKRFFMELGTMPDSSDAELEVAQASKKLTNKSVKKVLLRLRPHHR